MQRPCMTRAVKDGFQKGCRVLWLVRKQKQFAEDHDGQGYQWRKCHSSWISRYGVLGEFNGEHLNDIYIIWIISVLPSRKKTKNLLFGSSTDSLFLSYNQKWRIHHLIDVSFRSLLYFSTT